jgi:hypothetical protein
VVNDPTPENIAIRKPPETRTSDIPWCTRMENKLWRRTMEEVKTHAELKRQ